MKTKSINEFEKGDIITRIEPVQYPEDSIYGNLKDPIYIGMKFEFLGTANGCIYLKRSSDQSSIISAIFGDVLKLDLYSWKNGWDYYKEPDFLKKLDKSKGNIKDKISFIESEEDLSGLYLNEDEAEIKRAIDNAIKQEDYTRAAFLNKKLDELNKHKK